MSHRLTTTQPADAIQAWRQAAERQGKTISEWVGDACNARLTKAAQRKLKPRRPAHRPKAT